jgi:tetratricopeptide (TPR) repeat protein
MNRFVIAMAILGALAGGCGGPAPAPPNPNADAQFDLYVSSAHLEFRGDSIPLAATSYARALARAEAMDNPTDISSAAYDLAICRAAMGDYPTALNLLQEAQHEALRGGAGTTNIQLARARVYLLQNDWKSATRSTDEVLAGKPDDGQRLEAWILRGSAHCQAKDLSSARDDLKQVDALAAKVSDPTLAASRSGLSGEIHSMSKDFATAMTDFDSQAELCRQNHAYREMARALAKAGRSAALAGKPQQAADRLYRAARCCTSDAADLQAQALSAAQAAGDQNLIQLISSLPVQSTTQPAAP